MIKYLTTIIFLFEIIGCCACNNSDFLPNCPPPGAKDAPGIYSKPLGNVQIDGETCQVWEQYEKWNCEAQDGRYWSDRSWSEVDRGYNSEVPVCRSQRIFCNWKILSRITKCPSGTANNTIGIEKCGKACVRETIK